MKKIFLFLILCASVAGYSQSETPIGTSRLLYRHLYGVSADSVLGVPRDTFRVPLAFRNRPFLALKDSIPYAWSPSTLRWVKAGGGTDFVVGYGIQQIGSALRFSTALRDSLANVHAFQGYIKNAAGTNLGMVQFRDENGLFSASNKFRWFGDSALLLSGRTRVIVPFRSGSPGVTAFEAGMNEGWTNKIRIVKLGDDGIGADVIGWSFSTTPGYGQTTDVPRFYIGPYGDVRVLNSPSASIYNAPTFTVEALGGHTGTQYATIDANGTLGKAAAEFISSSEKTNYTTAFNERLRWDGSSTGLNAATGRTSLGATTVGSNLFTLPNPSAIRYPRTTAANGVELRTAAELASDIGAVTPTGIAILENKTISGANNSLTNIALASIRDADKISVTLETSITGGTGNLVTSSAVKDYVDYSVASVTSPYLRQYQIAGSALQAETLAASLRDLNTTVTLTDGTVRYVMVQVPQTVTVTNFRFITTQGAYTADAENAVGLYSTNGANIELQRTTGNIPDLFSASLGPRLVPFTGGGFTMYAGQIYYIAFLYNSSAQTTQPALSAASSWGNTFSSYADFTNNHKLSGIQSGQTALPATVPLSSIGANAGRPWAGLTNSPLN